MELKHEQLVYEKQAGCFFRRVVQDDRKRVLNCVILSLKYGELPISGLVNQEKVDIQDKKVDIGNINSRKKRSKIYEGTGKTDQLCDGADPEQ